jgi:hypothetical protein
MTHKTAVRFVTIEAKFIRQNNWDFVDVILLYPQLITKEYKVALVQIRPLTLIS